MIPQTKVTIANGRRKCNIISLSCHQSLYLHVYLQVDQGVLEELIDKELPTLGTRLKALGATQMIVSRQYILDFYDT